MEYFKAFFDVTKLPTKFFFLFSVVSGFILFASNFLLEKINLQNLNKEYGWIVGLIFILSSGLVIVNLILWLVNYITFKIRKAKLKKAFIKRLKNLDYHERAVLREFVINQTSSLEAPIDNPTIAGLIQKKILIINKQFGNTSIMTGMYASLSRHDLVEKSLKLKDIELPVGKPNDEELRFVQENRPSWVDNRILRR